MAHVFRNEVDKNFGKRPLVRVIKLAFDEDGKR